MKLAGTSVLVTGADGFIGSHLVERLVEAGSKVRAMVFYNSFNSWGWLESVPKDRLSSVQIVPADVRDPNGVLEAVRGCQVVFHLAALIGIPFSYHSPDSYVDTNIKGTLNVLQAGRKADVERLVITSTSEVYGTARYAPIDENHPFQGQSPYSATKIGADRLAQSFHLSFGTPVVVARPFNTYGPRQSARAVIPTLITQLLSGREELHLGNLKPTRDFNFVADTVAGFLALAEADSAVGREVNIASGIGHSIGALADLLIAEINPSAVIRTDEERVRPAHSEVQQLVGDSSLLRSLTPWRPQYDLAAGLRCTIEWFRRTENLSRYKEWLYNI